ncbi:hypothetical protein GOP47_0020549 [Adiantum capillus-veneris]|uniref:Uncharacterized protein n=1 Tax=Adiantum capillus-veneris TaxID=13818 RepID=A0A9D4Z731_ADICA|nr:hypothetical protein GOP47_0020549 [Adiantum capillus-veneris]
MAESFHGCMARSCCKKAMAERESKGRHGSLAFISLSSSTGHGEISRHREPWATTLAWTRVCRRPESNLPCMVSRESPWAKEAMSTQSLGQPAPVVRPHARFLACAGGSYCHRPKTSSFYFLFTLVGALGSPRAIPEAPPHHRTLSPSRNRPGLRLRHGIGKAVWAVFHTEFFAYICRQLYSTSAFHPRRFAQEITHRLYDGHSLQSRQKTLGACRHGNRKGYPSTQKRG